MPFTRTLSLSTWPLLAALLLPSVAYTQDTSPASEASSSAEAPTHSAMTARLFYDILLGEINWQQIQRTGEGNLRDAWIPIFESANSSKDERLYERALQIAVAGRDGPAALQVIRSWKLAHPQSSVANRNHIQILLALNRPQETIALLNQELRRSKPDERKRILEHIPQFYAQVTDKAKLADMLEPLLREHAASSDTNAVALVTEARMRQRAGQTERALEVLRGLLARLPDHAPALLLAVELIGPDRVMAEALVSDHLQRKPADHALRFAYARRLVQLERSNDAMAQLRQVIAGQPQWAMPHLILGTLAAEENNTAQAESSIQTYLRLQAQAPAEQEPARSQIQAHLVLSNLALKRNDFDRALYWLDQIKTPVDPLAMVIQRASIVARQGQLSEALSLLENHETEEVDDTRRRIMAMASLLRDQRQYQQAYELLGLWKLRLRNDAELLLQQAFMAEKLQRFDLMESLLREHMQRNPKEHSAYNALGYSLADRNERLPEAKSLIEKALSIVPGDPYVTDSLAWVEFRMGNAAKARELLERALARKPDAEIAAHLAEVYWALDLRDKAQEMAQRAQALGPDNETLLQTVKRLGIALPPPKSKP